MYSHNSLRTEGIDVLTFIDDTFDQRSVAVGHNEDLYREHCVKISTLPVVIDEVLIPYYVILTITRSDFLTQIQKTRKGDPTARRTSQQFSVAAIVVGLENVASGVFVRISLLHC